MVGERSNDHTHKFYGNGKMDKYDISNPVVLNKLWPNHARLKRS
jgi:hypothetical protein